MVGVDAGDVASGFDFDGAGFAAEVFEGVGDALFGVGKGGEDREWGEGGVVEQGGAVEIAAVGCEGGEVQ